MTTIDLTTVTPPKTNVKQLEAVHLARHSFAVDYARARGWDVTHITIQQLMEIRDQEGWKHPLGPGVKHIESNAVLVPVSIERLSK